MVRIALGIFALIRRECNSLTVFEKSANILI